MNRKLLSLLVASGVLLASACNNVNEQSNQAPKEQSASASAADGDCLLQYAQKYDQALTAAMVLEATGFSAEKMDTNYSRVMKNPAYHSILYRFKNGRVAMVRQLNREMEVPDVVQLSGLAKMTDAQFRNSYRALTEQEDKAANQAVEKLSSGETGNDKINESIKKLEENGVDKKEVKKAAGTLTDTFKEIAAAYEPVSGVADQACWNHVTQSLVLLSNGVKMELRVDVSNDNIKNKSIALSLAQKILAQCQ